MHCIFHNKLITRIVFLKSFQGVFPKSNYGLLDNSVITKSSMEIMTIVSQRWFWEMHPCVTILMSIVHKTVLKLLSL